MGELGDDAARNTRRGPVELDPKTLREGPLSRYLRCQAALRKEVDQHGQRHRRQHQQDELTVGSEIRIREVRKARQEHADVGCVSRVRCTRFWKWIASQSAAQKSWSMSRSPFGIVAACSGVSSGYFPRRCHPCTGDVAAEFVGTIEHQAVSRRQLGDTRLAVVEVNQLASSAARPAAGAPPGRSREQTM